MFADDFDSFAVAFLWLNFKLGFVTTIAYNAVFFMINLLSRVIDVKRFENSRLDQINDFLTNLVRGDGLEIEHCFQ